MSTILDTRETVPARVRKLLNKLETYAKRNKVRHKDLAAEFGVSSQQLSNWFRGVRTPNGETVLKIQEFLQKRQKPPTNKPSHEH